MRLHHYGFVGAGLELLQRRFRAESLAELTPPVRDPIQRVVVQFYRDRIAGDVWEIIAPLDTPENSPLAGRLARGGGLDHVCYELEEGDPSIEEIVATERGSGARVMCAPVFAAAFNRRVAFVLRRSGRLIEFVEPRREGDAV